MSVNVLTIYSEAGIEGAKDDEGEEAAVQYEQLTEENSTTPLLWAVENLYQLYPYGNSMLMLKFHHMWCNKFVQEAN